MKKRFIAVAGLGALLVASVAILDGPAQAGAVEVKAKLKTAAGVTIGNVAFREDTRSRVVTLRVTLRAGTGVSPGFHGFHVHANDNATNGEGCLADPAAAANTWFVSADGHFRHSTAEVHGAHAGDLSSVYVNANGTAELKLTKDALAPSELVGKVVILHAGADNFANVPVGPAGDQYSANSADALAKTQGTGNAGDRFACGVLALA